MVELAIVVAAPAVGVVMADRGAGVIKVETPAGGMVRIYRVQDFMHNVSSL